MQFKDKLKCYSFFKTCYLASQSCFTNLILCSHTSSSTHNVNCYKMKPKQNTGTSTPHPPQPPPYALVALAGALPCVSTHNLSWQRWAGLKIQYSLPQSRTGCTVCLCLGTAAANMPSPVTCSAHSTDFPGREEHGGTGWSVFTSLL